MIPTFNSERNRSNCHAMACPEAESRLKCFLHYGSEDRLYVPASSVNTTFEISKLKSVIDILSNEEAAKNIVPIIVKVKL